ncbi:hypothetical protein KI387_017653, partial [Taxus chinensis]
YEEIKMAVVGQFEKNKKKMKVKIQKNDSTNDPERVDKLKGKELQGQEGGLALKKNKKAKKQEVAAVDDDAEMSKLNGEELHEGETDLELKKINKSKKQKVPPVYNDTEMNKLEAEELHEGEGALSSKKKKKLKKKKTVPVDGDVGGKNTKVVPLNGMKKWLLEYHGKRPGIDVLMKEIDEFIVDHEDRLEKERKEREASAAAEGWTVVVHQKGRKKTVDAASGIAVGSVAEAAAKAKSAKKKSKEVDVDFYRFQRREARRNGPSTRAKKNLVTLGKTLDKDGIMIEEMESEGVNIDSLALGFTSIDHKNLSLRVENIPEENLNDLFLGGLKDHIEHEVRMFNPLKLSNSIIMARRAKEKVLCSRRPPFINIRDHSISSPSFSRSIRLTPQQMEEKRAKGLCFNYDSKYGPGHKCAEKKLFYIDRGNEDDEDAEIIEEAKEPIEDEVEDHQPTISCHALSDLLVLLKHSRSYESEGLGPLPYNKEEVKSRCEERKEEDSEGEGISNAELRNERRKGVGQQPKPRGSRKPSLLAQGGSYARVGRLK